MHRITMQEIKNVWVLQMWKDLQKPKRLFSHLSSLHIYLVHCLLGNIPHFLMKNIFNKIKRAVWRSHTQFHSEHFSWALQVCSQSSFKLSLRTTSCKQTKKDLWKRFWFVIFDIKNSTTIDPFHISGVLISSSHHR